VEALVDAHKKQAQQLLLGGCEEGLSYHELNISMSELEISTERPHFPPDFRK